MFTISFDETRLKAVTTVLEAFNAKQGTTYSLEQYLQYRANELADQAIYEYQIPPTRAQYEELKAKYDALLKQVTP